MNAQVNTSTLKCQQHGDLLLFEHAPFCSKCRWSIFDHAGGEKACGNMAGSGHAQAVSIAGFKSGQYQLCVIDGDMLQSTWFRIP